MDIGPIHIEHPLALAPMENVTDVTFRVMSKRLGADLVYTEFTSSEALIRDIPKALRKVKVLDEERPVGIQIFGGVEESMEKAARVVEGFKPDLIDINCGCWAKGHVQRGEGAGLLRDLKQFERVISSTVKATRLPVTVKTRLGLDENNIVILEAARIAEAAGAKALTVHCRTRAQGYKGQADWTWLERIKKVITIPLIGNGDVITPQNAKTLFDLGCDGVMIGRAAMGNPWIFAQMKHFLATGETLPLPPVDQRIALCLEHLRLSIEFKTAYYGIITFRKYYAGYLHGLPHAAHLRAELMAFTEYAPIEDLLLRYAQKDFRTYTPEI